MVTYCLVVEYNGKSFHGWQKQPKLETVQSALENTIKLVTKQDYVSVISASRTDSGVSARNQVARLRLKKEVEDIHRLARAVSFILRERCSIKYIEKVHDSYHPRHNVISKRYIYKIHNLKVPPVLMYGRAWHVSGPLNVESISRNLRAITGEYDFTSFRASGCQAVSPVKRILDSEVVRSKGLISISIEGSGFLKQMIRIIVGTLVDLEHNRLELKCIKSVLSSKNRLKAGKTAPAHGLMLDWTLYDVGIGVTEWRKSSEIQLES